MLLNFQVNFTVLLTFSIIFEVFLNFVTHSTWSFKVFFLLSKRDAGYITFFYVQTLTYICKYIFGPSSNYVKIVA